MVSNSELPIRPGDILWVQSRKKGEGGHQKTVESVTYDESRSEYVTVTFEDGGRTRHIPVAQVEDILIARAEDMRSPKTLELRYMETMLMSQLALIEASQGRAGGHLSSYQSQMEIQRSLYAVREHLRHRNARTALDAQAEVTNVHEA